LAGSALDGLAKILLRRKRGGERFAKVATVQKLDATADRRHRRRMFDF
jgi:hypothetical protein